MKSTLYCLLYTHPQSFCFSHVKAHSEHPQLHTLYICTSVYTCQHWTHPQSTCSSHITVHLQLLPTLLDTPFNTGYTHSVLAFHMQHSISSCSPPCCIICIHLSTLDTPTGHLMFIRKSPLSPSAPCQIHLTTLDTHPQSICFSLIHTQQSTSSCSPPCCIHLLTPDTHQAIALLSQQISSLKPIPCWSLSSSVHLLTLNMCPESLLLTHTHTNKVY